MASVKSLGSLLSTLHNPAFRRQGICTTVVCCKNIRSGVPKVTPNRSKPLTYEEAQPPYTIGVRKSWNSWNTANLKDETAITSQTTVEDMLIRRFIAGTWHRMFLSEVIVKRRQNVVVISGLVARSLAARKMYFLLGYTEEILSYMLKRPVRMEIQTINDRKDVIFKYI